MKGGFFVLVGLINVIARFNLCVSVVGGGGGGEDHELQEAALIQRGRLTSRTGAKC